MEKDVADMKALQKRLGESVGWIVDTLLLDEGENAAEDQAKKIRARKREALESLAYVRDVLRGSVTDIEEERLVGEEEFKRRKERLEKEKDGAPTRALETGHSSQVSQVHSIIHPPLPSHSQPAAPLPASVNEPRSRTITSRSSQHAFAPPNPHTAAASTFNSPRFDNAQPTGLITPWSSTVPALANSSRAASNVGAPRAPWNYTRSGFSGTTPSFTPPSLAPPPRASVIRVPPPPIALYKPHPPPPGQSPNKAQVHDDPLGVLR